MFFNSIYVCILLTLDKEESLKMEEILKRLFGKLPSGIKCGTNILVLGESEDKNKKPFICAITLITFEGDYVIFEVSGGQIGPKIVDKIICDKITGDFFYKPTYVPYGGSTSDKKKIDARFYFPEESKI